METSDNASDDQELGLPQHDHEEILFKSGFNNYELEYTPRWDEALIVEVSKHRHLYDPNCEKNRYSRAASWSDIAAQLNVAVPVCKARWKNIRTQYMKFKRESGIKSPRKPWPLFHLLAFLDDRDFKPSLTSLPISKKPTAPPGIRKLLPRPAPLAPHPPPCVVDTSILRHLEVKQPVQESRMDADEHYLLSLAPAFRRLTERAKAEARINIETVLYNAEFGAS